MKKQQIKAEVKPLAPVEVAPKIFTKKNFITKFLLLVCCIIAVIAYCDYKEYFTGDQANNHPQRKWRSFYRFADEQNKNADIVVLGNSHASAGVEPYIVSLVTGSNCFILNAAGTGVIDGYFNVKEVLAHKNKPKIVILETSCFFIPELGAEWGRIQSFESKKRSLGKFMSMFYLFNPDEWVKAWSPTIRNHTFLLTDSARMAYNKANVGVEKNPDKSNFDLGRFSHGSVSLKDSTIAKYAKNGPPVKCAEHKISDINVKYLKKLQKLCDQNGIQLLLFTAPMYYKTFDNYSIQKSIDLKTLKDIPNLKWLDLQQDYDSSLYTPLAFHDECHAAQHNTFYGMQLNSYKLSDFIVKNYSNILPNRQKDPNWINDFISTDLDFACNQDVVPAMKEYTVIAKNQDLNSFHVKEMVSKATKDKTLLILKIKNQVGLKESIVAVLDIENQNVRSSVSVNLGTQKNIFPPTHKVFMVELQKGIKILGLRNLQ